jgi:hypothetical protein
MADCWLHPSTNFALGRFGEGRRIGGLMLGSFVDTETIYMTCIACGSF